MPSLLGRPPSSFSRKDAAGCWRAKAAQGTRSCIPMSMAPHKLAPPMTSEFQDTDPLKRYQPYIPTVDQVFEDYLSGPSLRPSRFEEPLAKSNGLMEYHYQRMRRSQEVRKEHFREIEEKEPTSKIDSPCKRPFHATTGFSGHIPRKEAACIVGCTFAQGSRTAAQMQSDLYASFRGTGTDLQRRPSSALEKVRNTRSLPQLQLPRPSSASSTRTSDLLRKNLTTPKTAQQAWN